MPFRLANKLTYFKSFSIFTSLKVIKSVMKVEVLNTLVYVSESLG